MEKIAAFLDWWHSVFGSWSPNRLPSLSFWFLDDDLMQYIPMAASWLMLAVVICSVLSILHSLIRYQGGNLVIKLFTIPICSLGLFLLRFANDMSYELVHAGFGNFREIFFELAPALLAKPDILAFLGGLLELVIAIPLNLLQILLYAALTLLFLSPFIGLLVFNIVIYKWTAPIHFVADVGGGILVILGVMLIVLGAGMVGAIMVLSFGAPMLFQAVREWNFIASGGTIIRK